MCSIMTRELISWYGTTFIDLSNKVNQLLLRFEISSMAESEEINRDSIKPTRNAGNRHSNNEFTHHDNEMLGLLRSGRCKNSQVLIILAEKVTEKLSILSCKNISYIVVANDSWLHLLSVLWSKASTTQSLLLYFLYYSRPLKAVLVTVLLQ